MGCDAIVNAGTFDERRCDRDVVYCLVGLSFCWLHWEKMEGYFKQLIRDKIENAARATHEHLIKSHSIYYVQRKDGLIKIGYSKNVKLRIQTLSKDHGELKLLCTHEGYRLQEERAHSMFAKFNACGEWFYPNRRLLKHIYKVKNGYIPQFRQYF